MRSWWTLAVLLTITAGASCQRFGGDQAGQGGSSATGGAGTGGAPVDGAAGGAGSGGAPSVDAGGASDVTPGDGTSVDLAGPGCRATAQDPRLANLPPDVLILFDRSGSMQEDLTGMLCASSSCGATSKWSIATAALETFLPTTGTKVNWGLQLFGTGSNSSCSVSTTADVAPAPSTAAAIATVLEATVPSSSTPTTVALKNAAAYLKSFTDPNPKFILLVTDGSPTCGRAVCPPGSAATSAQCDDENAIAMVHSVHDDMGIPVFVLGIGTSMSPGSETLSMMAMAGGYPRAASPAYYPIESGDDLSRALGAVSGLVGNCYLIVTPTPTSASEIIDVRGDGTVLPTDPANGWSFARAGNSAGIRLNGKACEDYRSGAIRSVVVDLDLICATP